jgi:pectinesterase
MIKNNVGCAAAAIILRAGCGFAQATGAAPIVPAGFSATVAADGSGQYSSVQEAVNAAPQTTSPSSPWIIRVGAGTYHERVYVQREKHYVRLVGEDPARTTIAFDLYASMPGPDGKPIGTFHTPTVWIDADDFSVENLTLANTAGPKGQALALRVDGDRVTFRNCRFLGWQDTILVNRGRQYFAGCTISGAVDFIFGGATAYFENCEIRCLGNGYITAASTPAAQPYGFVFTNCRILGDPPTVRTYLGRPWRPYASVAFVGVQMTDVVRPVGWHNWNKPDAEKTSRYAEYASSGAGAAPAARVPWATTSAGPAPAELTPAHVLGGSDHWDPLSTAGAAIGPSASAEPVQH